MRAIHWLPQALDELQHIVAYIGQSSPNNAEKLYQRVESAVLPLTRFPFLFRESDNIPGLREIALDSNYLVFYRVTDARIEVVSIKHARQKFPRV